MGRHQLALPAKLEFLLLLEIPLGICLVDLPIQVRQQQQLWDPHEPISCPLLLELGSWVKWGKRGKTVVLQQQGRLALSHWLLQAARTSPPAFPWSQWLPNSLPVNSILS